MNSSTHQKSASLNHPQSGGMLLNLGIGIVVGLLVALVAVFFMMNGDGGPFKNMKNQATLPVAGQSTDPNAPLYGAAPMTLDPNANVAAGNTDVLTAGGVVSSGAKSGKPAPVKTPESDPLSDLIKSSGAEASDKGHSNHPADTTTPKTTKPADAKPADKAVKAPLDVKPVEVPKPKTVSEPAKPKAASEPAKPKIVTPKTVSEADGK